MKSILVPTDFSAMADYVLPLAEKIAEKENSQVAMLHAYDADYINVLPSYRNFAVHKMNDLFQFHHLMDWPHRCYLREGNMGDCIKQITRHQPVSLVVMGKGGAEENIESEIISRSACPVLAVPEGTLEKTISRIVYVTEQAYREEAFIRQAVHFASLFDARLTLLNVQNHPIGEGNKKKIFDLFLGLNYSKGLNEYIIAEDLIDGLKKYLAYNRTDIVAVAGAAHGWLVKNKNKQYVKPLLAYPGLPLLFINNGTAN